MNSQKFTELNLPDTPGVYFFKRAKEHGKGEEILYIGKATSLRNRVKSYFANDLIKTRGMFLLDMVSKAETITYEQTDSVLEALILEAEQIKRHQPYYNSREKDDKSFTFVIITKEDFPAIYTIRARDLEHKKIAEEINIKYQFGPFIQGGMLAEALKIIRRIFPFRDQTCQPHSGKACFNYQIGLCPGPCVDAISKQEYAKTIRNIQLFFQGKKGQLIKTLKKEMKMHAEKLEFEKAHKIKLQIFSLEHIKDSSLIKEEFRSESGTHLLPEAGPKKVFRIEAYDIAHMQGKSTTGVMVVVENGKAKKSDYRMFKIRRQGIDDVASLKEVLTRRMRHMEWPLPHMIVVDGGTAQFNLAKEILKKNELEIIVVAVTKNEKHKPKFIVGAQPIIEKHQKGILLANSEAHRFTLKYHRKLRSKQMFE